MSGRDGHMKDRWSRTKSGTSDCGSVWGRCSSPAGSRLRRVDPGWHVPGDSRFWTIRCGCATEFQQAGHWRSKRLMSSLGGIRVSGIPGKGSVSRCAVNWTTGNGVSGCK